MLRLQRGRGGARPAKICTIRGRRAKSDCIKCVCNHRTNICRLAAVENSQWRMPILLLIHYLFGQQVLVTRKWINNSIKLENKAVLTPPINLKIFAIYPLSTFINVLINLCIKSFFFLCSAAFS